ncbi:MULTISPECIES: MaoC/PaaZ C-terminal domain-containing protein [Actinomycetes]|jgi:acyl dehydratase|uniref:MaoC family dehydratase n=1 Tax=Actinomycetes TaxID=1760 RepID=UPI0004BEFDD7|nr:MULTISPECIES: MaoC/PaaZ C-terminal domain-containing protein [Actinomycetes]
MNTLEVGTQLFEATETIDQQRVRAYASAAKDDNAIHVDPEAARLLGLEAPVAHGMLTVGIALGHVMTWLGDASERFLRYETRFIKPVFVPPATAVELTVKGVVGAVNDGEVRIDVKVELVASGTTVLRPFRVFIRA